MLAYENIGIALLIYFFTRLSYSAITSEFVVMWGQDALAFNSEKHEERKTKTLINGFEVKLQNLCNHTQQNLNGMEEFWRRGR